MGFKDILVYVGGSPQSYATLTLAAELAQRFQAYLIGLHVIGLTLRHTIPRLISITPPALH